MTNRTFVIGDIHGCSKTLRRLVLDVIGLDRHDQLYLVGDLIDRGPDTKGVLDFIFELQDAGCAVRSVRGNHEQMYLQARESHLNMDLWSCNGGLETLESFQADGPGDIPRRYHDYLASLPFYLTLESFIIVHAGLNFDCPNPFADTDAMLWTRSDVVDLQRTLGRRLICGHTPVSRRQLESSLSQNKIMLDNGCVFTENPLLGRLAALELGSMTVLFQDNIDD